jgi:hypothetical protein
VKFAKFEKEFEKFFKKGNLHTSFSLPLSSFGPAGPPNLLSPQAKQGTGLSFPLPLSRARLRPS